MAQIINKSNICIRSEQKRCLIIKRFIFIYKDEKFLIIKQTQTQHIHASQPIIVFIIIIISIALSEKCIKLKPDNFEVNFFFRIYIMNQIYKSMQLIIRNLKLCCVFFFLFYIYNTHILVDFLVFFSLNEHV